MIKSATSERASERRVRIHVSVVTVGEARGSIGLLGNSGATTYLHYALFWGLEKKDILQHSAHTDIAFGVFEAESHTCTFAWDHTLNQCPSNTRAQEFQGKPEVVATLHKRRAHYLCRLYGEPDLRVWEQGIGWRWRLQLGKR